MFNVLVIDDDKNIRTLISAILKAENFSVLTATNGEDAFVVMDKNHVDLIIVDIMMPKMNGYEFTETLRNSYPELPVLMISAKQLSEDRKKGFLVGIDDFMTKPIDNEELVLHVKALLRRAKIASEKRICIGSVVLDYNSLTVSKKDLII